MNAASPFVFDVGRVLREGAPEPFSRVGETPERIGALAALDPGWIDRLIALLRGSGYDEVVLDIGAGLDPVPRRLSALCDTLLVVATDEPTSLTDAYAVMKLLARDAPGADARVVVNLASRTFGSRRTTPARGAPRPRKPRQARSSAAWVRVPPDASTARFTTTRA